MLPWACATIGVASFRRDAYTIGLERDGAIVAVVVFDNFSLVDCHMSVASDGSGHWLSRAFLAAVFAYPFQQLNMRRVTSLVGAKNTASRRFCAHLGFDVEGLCRHAMVDDDLVVMGLLREHCRFIHTEP